MCQELKFAAKEGLLLHIDIDRITASILQMEIFGHYLRFHLAWILRSVSPLKHHLQGDVAPSLCLYTREAWKHYLPRKDERAIVSQTNIETVSKATLGESSERRSGAHMGFSEHIDTIHDEVRSKESLTRSVRRIVPMGLATAVHRSGHKTRRFVHIL